MNITREDLPGRQVALTIELEPEIVNTALDRAYRQMVNQVNVPGFRKGKAPRYILERYVGLDALTERAVNNILPETVQDAISQQNIDALDVGDVEIVNLDPVTVKVTIIQRPVVELGDYGSIRVEKQLEEITDEQVDQVLLELRRDGAPWNEPAEPRPIKTGDMVYVNVEGFSGEGEIEEAKRNDFPTIVGMTSGGGLPEAVNLALEGMNVGDEKDIAATLPDDYPNEELRGRDVTYHVQALSMKEQQLPELDDEFTKTHGFDNVEALRETVDRNLKARAEEAAESNQISEIIRQLVESSNVEVPDVMVNEELDAMLASLENRLREQRLTVRQYFTYSGLTEQEWRERSRDRARERVIQGLVLHDFAHAEDIEVGESEVESEVEGMLGSFEGEEREKASSVLARSDTRRDVGDRLYQRKIVDRLIGIAEGRVVAKGPEKPAETETDGQEEALSASDIENAAGAAELLNTEEPHSVNETGEAEGGGTPESAPAIEAAREK